MSSKIIKVNKQTVPGLIINKYPSEYDLLNCIALKARCDLRNINLYYKNILKRDMEIRQKILNSQLEAKKNNEDIWWENNNLFYESKLIAKSLNKENNDYNYFNNPIEERQKKCFGYFKNLFVEMEKKGGIRYYTKKIIPYFEKIQKIQKSINKTIKSKSVIFKNNLKKDNCSKKLPFLKLSSIHEEKNSFIGNKPKKISLVKISTNKENNKSFLNNSQQNSTQLKLQSFKDESLRNKIKENKDINENTKISDNSKIIQSDSNIIYEKKKKEKIKKKKIKEIKNLNKSCDCLDRKFIFDKKLNPIVYSCEYKILSKRGNIQFNNSIWRTKNINDFIKPFEANEVKKILNEIKQERKILYH